MMFYLSWLFQRQVEVSHIMEGYMQVLLNFDSQPDDDMQLAMIGTWKYQINKLPVKVTSFYRAVFNR